MLRARRVSAWRSRYEIDADDRPLAAWDANLRRTGGTLDLAGHRYQVTGNMRGTRFEMTDEAGTVVAAADRVGRKRWTVHGGDATYRFERASWWRSDQQLIGDGGPIGYVRRVSLWRRDAVADLPGIPLPVQVFTLAVILTMWDVQAARAAAAGT